MNRRFLQLPKAQTEILEAWEWYENKQLGLGDRFVSNLRTKIDQIVNNPLHYPLKKKLREARIDDFPYLVIFKIDERNDLIVITSVFHTSRHPKRKFK